MSKNNFLTLIYNLYNVKLLNLKKNVAFIYCFINVLYSLSSFIIIIIKFILNNLKVILTLNLFQ